MDNKYILRGLVKIKMTGYIFKDGQSNETSLTNRPSVIQKCINLKIIEEGKPRFKIETPNSGDVKMIAGTNPINVRINA